MDLSPASRSLRRAPGEPAGDATLPPLALPFTVHTAADASRPAAPRAERSRGAQLGVWWADAEEGGPGVVVTGLLPHGPAAAAGALQVGDVILEVDGTPVGGLGDLTRHLDRFGAAQLRFKVRGPDGAQRGVTLEVPEAGPAAPAPGTPGVLPAAAQVPTTGLVESLSGYIECVLSNPLQSEVTHPGVAADPEFGCLGADLEFSLQSVGLSEIRNAVVRCEPRLKDVEVESVTLEVREGGEVHRRPGVRVSAKLAATGEPVRVDLEIEGLRRARRSHSRRLDAGVEKE
ncbi:MAG TPA: PDZ domain-containing protein [Candidatus Saccharimonadales bacterium]|nr:PDZ domain-containing protein [Candidatus Saccharimonadales bacterium]